METSKSDGKRLTRRKNGRQLSGLGLIETLVLLDKGPGRGGRWKKGEMRVLEMSGYRVSLASELAHRILGRKLKGISPFARLLLLLIREKAGKVGDGRKSLEAIVKYTGWKRLAVKKCLEELRQRGYIEKKGVGIGCAKVRKFPISCQNKG